MLSYSISRRLRIRRTAAGANTTGMVVAIIGVAIAVMVMELTLGIVLGFKNRITERVMGFEGQISVLPAYHQDTGTQDTWLTDSIIPDLRYSLHSDYTISARFTQPGILKTPSDFAGIYFVGRDSAYDAEFERGNIVRGIYPDYRDAKHRNDIVISEITARQLGIDTTSRVDACFFVDDAIKSRRLNVVGVYDSGFGEFDGTIAYADIAALRGIAGAGPDKATQIEILGVDGERIAQTAADLQDAMVNKYQHRWLDKLYPVDNVRHTGAQYFSWLDLLNTNVVVIFVLMLVVAAFTLISSMFIIILERIPTIGILRALGAGKKLIRSIFVWMSMRIVAVGLLIGNVLGLGLLILQEQLHLMPLDPEMYYLRYVPVEINWWWMIMLNIGVVAATWMILVLPSRLASSISPAVTMRFE